LVGTGHGDAAIRGAVHAGHVSYAERRPAARNDARRELTPELQIAIRDHTGD
jgi:hypothetical protein